MKILVTGALGYIGSNVALKLLKKNYDLVLLDNFSNSNKSVLDKIIHLSKKKIIFEELDIRDSKSLLKIFDKYNIDTVMHFAGLKSASESVKNSDEYFDVNVNGSKCLINSMEEAVLGKKSFIYSSSAAVYGKPLYLPIDEEHPLKPLNPYGLSKKMVEEELQRISKKSTDWKIVCLRYFNPVGSESPYLLGDNSENLSESLLQQINQVAAKNKPFLSIYGDDYETFDGSGVRDFIHISDLIEGHILTIKYIEKNNLKIDFINLGTGTGHSVKEIVQNYSNINKKDIPINIESRRDGEIDVSYANANKAEKLLKWKSKKNIKDMCSSTWKFYKKASKN